MICCNSDLPRNWHGCGSYTSNEGSLFTCCCNFPSNLFCAGEQVLIVAGGWDTPNFNILDSVELLTIGSSAWVFTNPLPRQSWCWDIGEFEVSEDNRSNFIHVLCFRAKTMSQK